MSTQPQSPAAAGLATLIILHLLMLMALFAGVQPHPPAAVAPFGMGPFIAVELSVAVSALMLGVTTTRAGCVLSVAAALFAMLSFGPQKYLDPQFALVWPAVITAQIAAVIIVAQALRAMRLSPAPA